MYFSLLKSSMRRLIVQEDEKVLRDPDSVISWLMPTARKMRASSFGKFDGH